MRTCLSRTAEYAIRAMAWLANGDADEEGGLRAADLSREISVPLAYLQKILRRLVVAGLLESQKGHGGGFRLARAPSDISVAEILRATDNELDEGRCTFGWGDCDPEQPCPVHAAWTRLADGLSGWAAETTLADMLVDELPAVRTRARTPRRP